MHIRSFQLVVSGALLLFGAICLLACEPALRIRPSEAPRLRLPENAGTHHSVPDAHRLGLITYNVGLARSVIADAELRSRALPAELEATEANVLCVQELWDAADATRMRAALRERFPHQVRPGARPVGSGACTEAESRGAFDCVAKKCPNLEGPELVRCALNACSAAADGLSKSCRSCLMNTEPTTLNEVRDACVTTAKRSDRTWSGPVWALKGSYGLALYSDIPFEDVRVVALESSVHPRAVVSVRLKTEPPARVLCTHLTPRLGSKHPVGGSYEEENAAQVKRLVGEARRAAGALTIVMGDLNTGPATTAADARLPSHYARLHQAGFSNPFLEQDGRCTYCYDNPLTGGHGERGVILTVYARRRFDLVVPLGNGQRVALSDHYGVEVLLEGVAR